MPNQDPQRVLGVLERREGAIVDQHAAFWNSAAAPRPARHLLRLGQAWLKRGSARGQQELRITPPEQGGRFFHPARRSSPEDDNHRRPDGPFAHHQKAAGPTAEIDQGQADEGTQDRRSPRRLSAAPPGKCWDRPWSPPPGGHSRADRAVGQCQTQSQCRYRDPMMEGTGRLGANSIGTFDDGRDPARAEYQAPGSGLSVDENRSPKQARARRNRGRRGVDGASGPRGPRTNSARHSFMGTRGAPAGRPDGGPGDRRSASKGPRPGQRGREEKR